MGGAGAQAPERVLYYELFTYPAYDGTNYCGFQVQPNGRSVAQTFQDALQAVLGSRPDIKGCSRTDAGVHALGFRLTEVPLMTTISNS